MPRETKDHPVVAARPAPWHAKGSAAVAIANQRPELRSRGALPTVRAVGGTVPDRGCGSKTRRYRLVERLRQGLFRPGPPKREDAAGCRG